MDVKAGLISTLKKHETGDEFSHLTFLPKASILIPLFLREGRVHVLLTVRSNQFQSLEAITENMSLAWTLEQQLKHNPGEVCFPGGKSDPHDQDEIHTALREASEEISLSPDEVEVVCKICPVMNQRGLLVTPVVAFISDSFQANPNPDEVSEVFSVPLDFFLKDINHSAYPVPNIAAYTHSFIYTDPVTDKIQQIWGLTAFLLVLMAILTFEKMPEYEVGFDMEDPCAKLREYLQRRLSKL